MNQPNQKGFTLIELVLSLVIVSFIVLASASVLLIYQTTINRMNIRERALSEVDTVMTLFTANPSDLGVELDAFYGSAHTQDGNTHTIRFSGRFAPAENGTLVMTATVLEIMGYYQIQIALDEEITLDGRALKRTVHEVTP